MPTNILMPALSPTMEKGNLAKWLVKEGDTVKSGDVIAEIETDKATMEVEAVDEGTIGKIVVAEGTADVPVNELIAILLEEGEDASAHEGRRQARAEGGARAGQGRSARRRRPSEAKPRRGAQVRARRPRRKPAPNGHDKGDARLRVAAGAPPRQGGGHRRRRDLRLRPAWPGGEGRRRAGQGFRRRQDAPAAKAPEAARRPPPARPRPPALPTRRPRSCFPEGSFEEIPHDGMRKTIARRLTEARQTVPQFYLTVDCEIDELLKLREQINASAPETDGKPAWKVSVNDMVIKALGVALAQVPDANVTWTEGAMLKHKHADVGVAVALPGNGLITPIIRAVETKTLSTIAREMKDFAARAKARKLKPEEYQGGTTAVSNLGMFGIKDFTAVINPPHSTILAVGGGEKRRGGEGRRDQGRDRYEPDASLRPPRGRRRARRDADLGGQEADRERRWGCWFNYRRVTPGIRPGIHDFDVRRSAVRTS